LLLSTFGLQNLTESARRADNAKLLGSLPFLPMDCHNILKAFNETGSS
jgi:hypothetical protein